MNRTRLPLCALLLLGAAWCAGCRTKQEKVSRPGKIIVLSDTIVDTGGADTLHFGALRSGETASLRLGLTNSSSQTLLPLSATASCACTSVRFESQPVKPGQTIPLTVSFDTGGLYGWQFKLVELHVRGMRRPLKIYIDAQVE